MMSKVPWVISSLSVLFNCFFAGSLVQTKHEQHEASTEQGVADQVAERLGLDETQRAAYVELRQSAHEQAEQLRRDIQQARGQFWADLAGQSPDRDQLAELQEFVAEQKLQHRLIMGKKFREFLDILRPEQRQKMVDMVHERFGPGGPDGPGGPGLEGPRRPGGRQGGREGLFSEQDRQGFRERMDAFRLRRPPPASGPGDPLRRERILRRFDADGDGALNAEERARAAEALRAHRERGARNGGNE